MKVIKATLVILINSQRKNCSEKNIPLKLNLISCHGDNNVIKTEQIADLNDFKSY